MQAPSSAIVAFGPDHLDGAVALSRQAGWPHRPEDWRLALDLSRGVVACGDDGRVIGTALMTPYEQGCATINMVIVDEAQRGRGLGRLLMQAALDLAGDRPLRLVATADGLPLYEKLGFRAVGQVVQHQGLVRSLEAPVDVAVTAEPDPARLVALDAAAFGTRRAALIGTLARIGRVAEWRAPDGLAGFAVLRPFGRGEVIGPVVARSVEDAKALIGFWAAQRPGAFLRLDTTAATGLSPWLADLGLAEVGGGIAMRRGGADDSAPSAFTTYALANQAFG